MGTKDKGEKKAKKEPKRSIKEKRAAKKQKKSGGSGTVRPIQ